MKGEKREKRREVLQTKLMKSDPGGRTRRERRTGGGGRGVRGERCDPGFKKPDRRKNIDS